MLKIGQRWRGKYNRSLVVEIIGISGTTCMCKIVDEETNPNNKEFSRIGKAEVFAMFPDITQENEAWEFLEGQDKPQD